MRVLRAILAHWGIQARHAGLRGLPCVAAYLVAVLVCWQLCGPGVVAVVAAPQGGVPTATWQDNARNHRGSPNQIVTQLRTPQAQVGLTPHTQAGQMPLAAEYRLVVASRPAMPVFAARSRKMGFNFWSILL